MMKQFFWCAVVLCAASASAMNNAVEKKVWTADDVRKVPASELFKGGYDRSIQPYRCLTSDWISYDLSQKFNQGNFVHSIAHGNRLSLSAPVVSPLETVRSAQAVYKDMVINARITDDYNVRLTASVGNKPLVVHIPVPEKAHCLSLSHNLFKLLIGDGAGGVVCYNMHTLLASDNALNVQPIFKSRSDDNRAVTAVAFDTRGYNVAYMTGNKASKPHVYLYDRTRARTMQLLSFGAKEHPSCNYAALFGYLFILSCAELARQTSFSDYQLPIDLVYVCYFYGLLSTILKFPTREHEVNFGFADDNSFIASPSVSDDVITRWWRLPKVDGMTAVKHARYAEIFYQIQQQQNQKLNDEQISDALAQLKMLAKCVTIFGHPMRVIVSNRLDQMRKKFKEMRAQQNG